jgi:YebC/PmpR family DNA-binding regulatory protein
MAGHSHWKSIKHKKGAIDAKRGKLFGKLSRYIIIAARQGGGDPDMNLKLRYAIDKARSVSMPWENIDRAIKRGTGELEGGQLEEVTYEGYGPGGVAVLAESLTDNRHRTAGEIRKIFDNWGGKVGTSGCVAWMFKLQGLITLEAASIEEDRLIELALEAGADDVKRTSDTFEVICDPTAFQAVKAAIDHAKLTPTSAELAQIPSTMIDLEGDNAQKMLRLMEELDDHEDVQNVYANFSIAESVMAAAESD